MAITKPYTDYFPAYADVIANFAIGRWIGVQPGEIILLQAQESAKELLLCLQTAVLQAGWHPIIDYYPDGFEQAFYAHASDEQINFWPDDLARSKVAGINHRIKIISPSVEEAGTVRQRHLCANRMRWWWMLFDAKLLMDRGAKENISRTLCLFGTPEIAAQAWLSLEEYWEQIILGCYLDDVDPKARRRETFAKIDEIKAKLDKLEIQKIHMTGDDIDLHVALWANRKWLGATGNNIPSFEVFISPDWRGTQGYMKFSEPLMYDNKRISGIELVFKNGEVVSGYAKEGNDELQALLNVPNANKIGEFSLTDSRFSSITKFMSTTLFDENVWWKYGNSHIALGNAYPSSYTGNIATATDTDREDMWFNKSDAHVDIVSTTDRVVEAECSSWDKIIIYKNGMFCI